MSFNSWFLAIFRKSKPLNLNYQAKMTHVVQDYSWFYQGKYENNNNDLLEKKSQ